MKWKCFLWCDIVYLFLFACRQYLFTHLFTQCFLFLYTILVCSQPPLGIACAVASHLLSIDWWIYQIMHIEWYWWVRIWSVPLSFTHMSSWGFVSGPSVCRRKIKVQEEIELKNRWQWRSGLTGKKSVGEFTIWTTCVSVCCWSSTCGRRDKCVKV